MIQGQIKENIITSCVKIENFDFGKLVPHSGNLPNYSLEEFVMLTKKAAKQLREELTKGFGEFLPVQYNFHNEYGSGNLESDLINFINYIEPASINLNAAVQNLNRFVYYQVANGFWDRAVRKIHSSQDVNVVELNDKIVTLEKVIKQKIEEVSNEKQNLVDFISQKTSELQQIERNVQTANTNTNQINSLLTDSTQNNEKINSLVTQQQEKFEEIKKTIEEQKKEYSTFKSELEHSIQTGQGFIKSFEEKNEDFKKNLDFVDSKKKHFEDRNSYLDNLIGREVGASLFETFKQRKNELSNPVFWWSIAVPITTIATIVWVIVLFDDLQSIHDLNQRWEFFAINTLKTAPAIILLFFVINQYRKERNFQEEYAFKSAVALTIKAYSEQIKLEENKDKLILEAVGRIYSSPIHQKSHKEEDSKNLIDEVKNIKDTVIDLVKSVKQ
ncbi:MAG: hypothetical protein HY842_15710 [Bacteroidetes bacterium]|nr:hypothetical protein [Bacteroidota bacterium]